MTTLSDHQADILIIGSGIGGLSAAILLTQLGYRVIVAEKNAEPGGLMRGYLRGGMACPVGVHYLGSLDRGQPLKRIFDYMGVTGRFPLERMGRGGIIDRYVFDRFIFDLPEGLDPFAENLHRTFPGDAEAIRAIMKNLHDITAAVQNLDFLFSPLSALWFSDYLRPLGEYLSELHCSPALRSVLAMPASWVGVPIEECPLFLHHMALATYLLSSWRLSGSGTEMAEAFASRLREMGGVIMTRQEAQRIILHDGAVEGVIFKSGLILKTPLIISTIHPKMLLPMLPEGALKPAHKRRIKDLEDTHGLFAAVIGLDRATYGDLPYNVFRVHNGADGRISGGAFYQLRKSNKPDLSIMSMITSSSIDEWQPWEKTSSGNRGPAYLAEKQRRTDHLLQWAREIFGPLEGAAVIDSYTPLTIRDWVNSPGGSAYGILRSTTQMHKFAALNRMDIGGLFLAGQSALAPGIFGTVIGSLNVVRQIIGQERFSREVAL